VVFIFLIICAALDIINIFCYHSDSIAEARKEQKIWEKIQEKMGSEHTSESHRLKVPGGWIVRTMVSRYHAGADVAHTFVADPQHEWVLEPEPAS